MGWIFTKRHYTGTVKYKPMKKLILLTLPLLLVACGTSKVRPVEISTDTPPQRVIVPAEDSKEEAKTEEKTGKEVLAKPKESPKTTETDPKTDEMTKEIDAMIDDLISDL
jgi:hypothetical protein